MNGDGIEDCSQFPQNNNNRNRNDHLCSNYSRKTPAIVGVNAINNVDLYIALQ